MLNQLSEFLRRPLRLIAVGLIATLAYSVFSLGFVWLAGFNAPISSLLGHGLAGFVSYFGHRKFTFEIAGDHDGAPGRFILLNVTSCFVAALSPLIATRIFFLPDTSAILITAIIVPAVNAVLIAKLVFRRDIIVQTANKIEFNHGK
jgi:putative flippase GtrA